MNKSFTIEYLDHLPAIPPELVGDLRRFQTNMLIRSTHANAGDLDQTPKTHYGDLDPDKFYGFEISGPLLDWIRANVLDEPVVTNAVFFGPRKETIDTDKSRYPHVDVTRNLCLMYVTEPGGECVETKFYKHKDHPVYIEPDIKMGDSIRGNPEDLTEIDSIQIEPNRWALLNSRIIHKVTGIDNMRVNIQLSLDIHHYDVLTSKE